MLSPILGGMDVPDNRHPDVPCDICGISTRVHGYGGQFGVLQAHWGYGARHDGERYRVRMCETCFFMTLAYLRQERRIHHLFDDAPQHDDCEFGRIARDDYWLDS